MYKAITKGRSDRKGVGSAFTVNVDTRLKHSPTNTEKPPLRQNQYTCFHSYIQSDFKQVDVSFVYKNAENYNF